MSHSFTEPEKVHMYIGISQLDSIKTSINYHPAKANTT